MMNWKSDWKPLVLLVAVFVVIGLVPVGSSRFDTAVIGALDLAQWYVQEHMLTCLIPAFYLAGAVSVFVSRASMIRCLGAGANRLLSYGVAAASGAILAVCSCTALPLFAGIYRMGAGLGPACTFLYSSPAINVLAIMLSAHVLGLRIGIARALGAVVLSIVVGALMELLFRQDEPAARGLSAMSAAGTGKAEAAEEQKTARPLWQNLIFFGLLVLMLIFANFTCACSAGAYEGGRLWRTLYLARWLITAALALALALVLVTWFKVAWWKLLASGAAVALLAGVLPAYPQVAFAAGLLGFSVALATSGGEALGWFEATWDLAKQIMPLLLVGILAAGLLLGGQGNQGLLPAEWIAGLLGGNSLLANLLASVLGALMYFATLTEVPIVKGLMDGGMGQGPALALLLAGPALSLPSMLVIRSIMGTKKSLALILLVVLMSIAAGILYGVF